MVKVKCPKCSKLTITSLDSPKNLNEEQRRLKEYYDEKPMSEWRKFEECMWCGHIFLGEA